VYSPRFLHSIAMIAVIYTFSLLVYLSPGVINSAIGWTAQAHLWWLSTVGFLLLFCFMILLPLISRLLPLPLLVTATATTTTSTKAAVLGDSGSGSGSSDPTVKSRTVIVQPAPPTISVPPGMVHVLSLLLF
jgi:hypothetical protein